MKKGLIFCAIISMNFFVGCSKESKEKIMHGSEIQSTPAASEPKPTDPTPTDINMPEPGQK